MFDDDDYDWDFTLGLLMGDQGRWHRTHDYQRHERILKALRLVQAEGRARSRQERNRQADEDEMLRDEIAELRLLVVAMMAMMKAKGQWDAAVFDALKERLDASDGERDGRLAKPRPRSPGRRPGVYTRRQLQAFAGRAAKRSLRNRREL